METDRRLRGWGTGSAPPACKRRPGLDFPPPGAGEPATELHSTQEPGPATLGSGTRLLQVLGPPPCPRLAPPFCCFFLSFPSLFLLRVDHAGEGMGEDSRKKAMC